MVEKIKILFIDDNEDLGMVVKQVLELDEYEVHYISDPQKALELLKEEMFAVVLCDYNMPGLNGDDVIREIRASGLITPVMFLTGYPTKDFVVTALRLGAADVLEKPCPYEVLNRSIKRVLEIERRRCEVYAEMFSNPEDPALKKKLKMLGLMQIANQKKTA